MAFTRGKGAAARLKVKLWLFCQGLSAQHKEVSAPALESHSVRNKGRQRAHSQCAQSA